jgi:hypothetical protein
MTCSQTLSRIFSSTILLVAAALAGCPSNDNNLGTEADSGAGVTCQEGGKTYQPGQTVTRSACTSCMCLTDGTIGDCTGLCIRDAAPTPDTKVTCEKNGVTYQVGETVVLSACTTCLCQADGTIGLCTGACPADAAPAPDTKVTCESNGATYQVGDVVVLSACTSCVCQATGQLGMCTGACPPPDAGADAQSDPAALCTNSGGSIITSLCCANISDFPPTCSIGACSCGPGSTHSINTCECPTGGCFDLTYGCVSFSAVCTPGADQTCNDNPATSAVHGHCLADQRCSCNSPYKLLSSGKCS